MRPRTLILALVPLFVSAARAEWAGHGEVTGEVTVANALPDGSVLVQVNLHNQVIQAGPALGPGNLFHYAGPGRERLSPGDVVRMKVNRGGNPGIRVESVDFLNDFPGAPVPVGAMHGMPRGMALPTPKPPPEGVEAFFASGRGFLLGALLIFVALVAAFVLAEAGQRRSRKHLTPRPRPRARPCSSGRRRTRAACGPARTTRPRRRPSSAPRRGRRRPKARTRSPPPSSAS